MNSTTLTLIISIPPAATPSDRLSCVIVCQQAGSSLRPVQPSSKDRYDTTQEVPTTKSTQTADQSSHRSDDHDEYLRHKGKQTTNSTYKNYLVMQTQHDKESSIERDADKAVTGKSLSNKITTDEKNPLNVHSTSDCIRQRRALEIRERETEQVSEAETESSLTTKSTQLESTKAELPPKSAIVNKLNKTVTIEARIMDRTGSKVQSQSYESANKNQTFSSTDEPEQETEAATESTQLTEAKSESSPTSGIGHDQNNNITVEPKTKNITKDGIPFKLQSTSKVVHQNNALKSTEATEEQENEVPLKLQSTSEEVHSNNTLKSTEATDEQENKAATGPLEKSETSDVTIKSDVVPESNVNITAESKMINETVDKIPLKKQTSELANREKKINVTETTKDKETGPINKSPVHNETRIEISQTSNPERKSNKNITEESNSKNMTVVKVPVNVKSSESTNQVKVSKLLDETKGQERETANQSTNENETILELGAESDIVPEQNKITSLKSTTNNITAEKVQQNVQSSSEPSHKNNSLDLIEPKTEQEIEAVNEYEYPHQNEAVSETTNKSDVVQDPPKNTTSQSETKKVNTNKVQSKVQSFSEPAHHDNTLELEAKPEHDSAVQSAQQNENISKFDVESSTANETNKNTIEPETQNLTVAKAQSKAQIAAIIINQDSTLDVTEVITDQLETKANSQSTPKNGTQSELSKKTSIGHEPSKNITLNSETKKISEGEAQLKVEPSSELHKDKTVDLNKATEQGADAATPSNTEGIAELVVESDISQEANNNISIESGVKNVTGVEVQLGQVSESADAVLDLNAGSGEPVTEFATELPQQENSTFNNGIGPAANVLDNDFYFSSPDPQRNNTFRFGKAEEVDAMIILNSKGKNQTNYYPSGPASKSLTENEQSFKYTNVPDLDPDHLYMKGEITEVSVRNGTKQHAYAVGNNHAIQHFVDEFNSGSIFSSHDIVKIDIRKHFGAHFNTLPFETYHNKDVKANATVRTSVTSERTVEDISKNSRKNLDDTSTIHSLYPNDVYSSEFNANLTDDTTIQVDVVVRDYTTDLTETVTQQGTITFNEIPTPIDSTDQAVIDPQTEVLLSSELADNTTLDLTAGLTEPVTEFATELPPTQNSTIHYGIGPASDVLDGDFYFASPDPKKKNTFRFGKAEDVDAVLRLDSKVRGLRFPNIGGTENTSMTESFEANPNHLHMKGEITEVVIHNGTKHFAYAVGNSHAIQHLIDEFNSGSFLNPKNLVKIDVRRHHGARFNTLPSETSHKNEQQETNSTSATNKTTIENPASEAKKSSKEIEPLPSLYSYHPKDIYFVQFHVNDTEDANGQAGVKISERPFILLLIVVGITNVMWRI